MSHLPFDSAEVLKTLSIIISRGQVFEIRILGPKLAHKTWAPRTISGYFNDSQLVIPALEALNLAGAKGIYVTLNPVDPALLARSHNKLSEIKEEATTGDKNITNRTWFFVDVDPKRPSGISASNEEKEYARERVKAVYFYLKDAGWPDPVEADSGNGFHLLYPVDILADDEVLKHCLVALDQRFSDDRVAIDTTVFNPARIVKLYGTRAEKGEHCPDLGRPHRMSQLIRVPDKIEMVSKASLDALVSESKTNTSVALLPKHVSGEGSRWSWDREKVQAFVDKHLASCRPCPVAPYDGGFKWVLEVCPFNAEHRNRSAVIVIKANGTLGFKCHHDGCKGNNWKTLRALYEPKLIPPIERQTDAVVIGTVDEELVTQYGPLFMVNDNGIPSDLNQMFIAGKYAQDTLVLHEPVLNLFYEYEEETGLWRPKTEARLKVELGNALRFMLNEQGSIMLLKKRSENLLGQILRLLKGMIERADAFRKIKPIIHVGNGVLHMDAEPPTLNEFSPHYFSRNRSEICFDEDAECPRFINDLLGPALNADDITLLQKYAGQCLLGNNPSQKILLLRGTPGGGKSTVVNVLESIIGSHNVTQLRVSLLAERFEIAGFVGKTLLCGKDVPGDFLNNKSAYVLKALVGGDRLNAEQKNIKHRFELFGEFNVIITSNSRLHVRLDADSGAWRRRLLIVDYEQPSTSKPIPNFDQILVKTEGPGILNWCIAGALDLLDELKTYGRLQLAEAQTQRIDALLCESDSIRHFVIARIKPNSSTNITINELQTAYHNFCEEQGWQAVTVRQFENQVSNIMMEVHRAAKRTDIVRNDKNQRGFAHLSIVSTEEEVDS